METKNNIFKEYLDQYLLSNKVEKGKILDHVCFVSKVHRKAAVRKFHVLQLRSDMVVEGRGRPIYYGFEVTAALKEIWRASSELCGELVHPVIAEYVAILQRDGMWSHAPETTAKLLTMSEGTVKLRVARFMSGRSPNYGISSTKPSLLREIIPVFVGPWQDKPPGYGQLDTVVHCGSSLLGEMAFTVNWTDVATLWGGRKAQWNKGQTVTKDSLSAIKDGLPFPMLGAHPDTGGEFINWHLKGWCDEHQVELTRSRPYHKNDNAYVEQKNGHIVRRFLGYRRLDNSQVIPVINRLYQILDLYLNHFVPSRKLTEKTRIGAKYRKRYDRARTPYQRVMEHPAISQEIKTKLSSKHEQLNPLLLRDEVVRLVTAVFKKQEEK